MLNVCNVNFVIPKHTLCIVYLLLVLCGRCIAQTPFCATGKEGNIWYFGDSLGLDFNTLPPQVVTDGKMYTYEASATVSDGNGDLLFYFNGEYVWNCNHQIMPGVNPAIGAIKLSGSESATQVLALQHPGSPNLYYLFYMNTFGQAVTVAQDTTRSMFYAVVDINADGGLGDVISKNNLLFTKTTEKVIAARHCNGIDWWIVTLESGSNRFLVWKLDQNGLNLTPDVFQTGRESLPFDAYKGGELLISSDAEYLLKCRFPWRTFNNPTWDGYVELFRFDNATGAISDPIVVVDGVRSIYSAEFSPDNKKLYFNAWTPSDSLYQYDLCVWDSMAIRNSKVNLGRAVDNTGQLQLGPDGKIYITSNFRNYLSVIHQPNLVGAACQYEPQAIATPRECLLGLPTFPASYYAPYKPYITQDAVAENCTPPCADSLRKYYVTGHCRNGASYAWSVLGGTVEQQQHDTVWVRWTQPGPGWVAVVNTWACGTFVDTVRVEVENCAPCAPVYDTLIATACSGETYPYNGQNIPAGSSQSFLVSNASGCDSTVTVSVTALQPSASTINASACVGETYAYNGVDIPAGSSQIFNFSNAVGCDSTVTVNVTALQPSTGTVNTSACAGETYAYNGVDIPAGSSQIFNFSNAAGCDSTVTVNVTALKPSAATINASACAGETYSYNGVDIPAGSSQIFNFSNAAGCDSTVTVNVTALQPSTGTVNASACAGETFTYNGVDIPTGSSQTFVFLNAAGCDSTVTVNVAVLQPSNFTLNASACAGGTYNYNGVDIPAGSTQSFVFSNAAGCDSTVTINVAALQPSSSAITASACAGKAYTYNGVDIPAGSSQDFVFFNSVGCDSTVSVIVEALQPSAVTLNASACEGGTYTYNGVDILAGSSQTFVFSSAAGCDSIVTINVAAMQPSVATITASACAGEAYNYNSVDIPAGSTQTFVFSTTAGCDSTVTVNVAALQPSVATITESACEGGTYSYNGVAIPAGNSQTFVFLNAAGCDSTVTITVAALQPSSSVITASACAGEAYTYNGLDIPAGSSQDFVYFNAVGCDSTVSVIVEALQSSIVSLNASACMGETYTYNGTDIPAGSSQTFVFSNSAGCDSTVTINVATLQPSVSFINASVCLGETYSYNGFDIPAGTSQDFMFSNAAGCDSTITVNVDALQPSVSFINASTCAGETYSYNGVNIPAGNSQSFIFSNTSGCDSTVTVNVTALQPSTSTIAASACAGEAYSYNGVDIPAGSSQSFVLSNAAGCDSTVTVSVAVLQPSNFTLNASACAGETYTYNGVDIPAGSTQTFVYSTSAGCDSTVTVSVLELPLPQFEASTTPACPGAADGAILVDAIGVQTLVFQLDGATVNEDALLQLTSGTFTLSVSDAFSGCLVVEEITVEEQSTAQAVLPQRHLLPCDTWEIGLSVSLDGPAPATGFLWSTGAQTPDIIVNEPGLYWVKVSDACGVQKLETTVEPEMPNEATDIVYMANVFRPSGAENPMNSVFAPQFSSAITVDNLTFSVYDRWGGLVFTSRSNGLGWDGGDAQPGVYIWLLNAEVTYCGHTFTIERSGDVTLVK